MRCRIALSLAVCMVVLTASVAIAAEKTVTLDIKDKTLGDVIPSLMKDSGRDYSIDPEAAKLRVADLKFVDVPFDQALNSLMKAAGAVYRSANGILLISAKPGKPGSGAWADMVNLELNSIPLAEALKALFKDTDISYALEPRMPMVVVTANLRNVTRERALSELAKAAGVEYQIEGNIVRFSPPSQGYGPYGGYSGYGPPPGEENMVSKIVALRFAFPADVMPVLAGRRGLYVTATSGDKLVLRGTPEAVEEALPLIEAVDDENLLPRPISIKISVRETGREGNKSPATTEINISTAEEMRAEMEVSSNVPLPKPGATPTPGAARQGITTLRASLLPTLDEGRICITGSISFRWLVDEGQGPVEISGNEISTTRCFEPGKPTVIAGFNRRTDDGKGDASLEVTAVATIGEGRVRVPRGPRPPAGGYGGGGYGGYGGGGYGGAPAPPRVDPGAPRAIGPHPAEPGPARPTPPASRGW